MSGPLIAQSDKTVLLETDNEAFAVARDALGRFAELVKSPEHFHTYRITPLSLWNARSAGMTVEEILGVLEAYGRYAPPHNVVSEIRDFCGRYGRLRLQTTGEELFLESDDTILLTEVARHKFVAPLIQSTDASGHVWVRPGMRGHVKQALLKAGFPVEDLAGYRTGDELDLHLRTVTAAGEPLALRPYQKQAVDGFLLDGSPAGGNGVIVLPCGAGKTLVGMAIMERMRTHTLILVTNVSAIHQWRRELLDKTDLSPDRIGEYSGERKDIAPVTLATYNILTYRKRGDADFDPHEGASPGWARSHTGRSDRMGGNESKLCSGGGEDVAHSSVPAPQNCKHGGGWGSRPHCFGKTRRKMMSSASSGRSDLTFHGKCSNNRTGSPRPSASKSGFLWPRIPAWFTRLRRKPKSTVWLRSIR